MESGPVRLAILVNWSGLPLQDGFAPAAFAATDAPARAAWGATQDAMLMNAGRTSNASARRRKGLRPNIITPVIHTLGASAPRASSVYGCNRRRGYSASTFAQSPPFRAAGDQSIAARARGNAGAPGN